MRRDFLSILLWRPSAGSSGVASLRQSKGRHCQALRAPGNLNDCGGVLGLQIAIAGIADFRYTFDLNFLTL
jgi:hypothetical protein